MPVQTKYLGEIEINEEQIIEFSSGIPGFLDELKFVLLDFPGNPLFQFLQSLKTPELAFIVTNPHHFYRDYEFELDEQVQESLKIKSEKDVLLRAIVTLKQPFQNSTLNLKAPLIINPNARLGKQYILNTDEYSTQAPIVLPSEKVTKGE